MRHKILCEFQILARFIFISFLMLTMVLFDQIGCILRFLNPMTIYSYLLALGFIDLSSTN